MPSAGHLRAAAGEGAVDDDVCASVADTASESCHSSCSRVLANIRRPSGPTTCARSSWSCDVVRVGALGQIGAADAEVLLGVAPLVVREAQRLIAGQRVVDQAVHRPVVERMLQGEELRSMLAVRQRDVRRPACRSRCGLRPTGRTSSCP